MSTVAASMACYHHVCECQRTECVCSKAVSACAALVVYAGADTSAEYLSLGRAEVVRHRARPTWPVRPPAAMGVPRPAPARPSSPRRPALVVRHRSRQVRLLHRCRLGRSA